MKFGKSYMETLADPSFPKEWREGAIEYKHLKKLINGVVAELESLGLGADVLRDLIVPPSTNANDDDDDDEEEEEEDDGSKDFEPRHKHDRKEVEESELSDAMEELDLDRPQSETHRRHRDHSPTQAQSSADERATSSSADDCELCAHSFLQHKADQANNPQSPAVQWVSSISHAQHSRKQRRRSSRQSINARKGTKSVVSGDHLQVPSLAIDDDGDSDEESEVQIMEPPYHPTDESDKSSSDQSTGKSYHGIGKKDLEKLRRASNASKTTKKSLDESRASISTAPSDADREHDWTGHAWRERAAVTPTATSKSGLQTTDHPSGKGKWVHGKDGRRARAEYELGGTKEHPVPRIRLFVESPIQSDEEVTPGDEADSEGVSDDDEAEEETREGSKDDDDRIVELPESPRSTADTIRPIQGKVRSPRLPANEKGKKREMRHREILIPLTADSEFLDTLTGALANVSSLQQAQRESFIQSTESLCKSVARVSSPYATQNDLYVWREIFSLWCEFQIFESQREKDRGELSVDESEERLKRFAEEMAKRGWTAEAFEHDKKSARGGKLAKLRRQGDRSSSSSSPTLPMKDRQSIEALQDFLKLNLALLDVKKFQRVNVEAARKILKKHDKRTALTASNDYRDFLAKQDAIRTTAAAAAGIGLSGLVKLPSDSLGDAAASSALITTHGSTHPSLAALLPTSTTAILSESLPHILLSLLSTTLLPILPSIDDYSCAICTGVAWRPIQLDCSHLFCIRCLVKLQKRGKSDCPLCRAKGVVGSADGRNMDAATVKFVKEWFPKEVKEKEKENEQDRKKEEMQELGLALDAGKCSVM